MSNKNTNSAGLLIALLCPGVFLFSLKLEHDAAALQSRADDVIATATSMSAADEAIRHLGKARRLSGAATGMRIGAFVAVIVGIGAWLGRRAD